MKFRPFLMIVFAGFLLLQLAVKPSHQMKPVKSLPEKLPKTLSPALSPSGIEIVGPSKTLGKLWFAKELAVKPGFKPGFSVKYPLTQGQLVGVLHVEADASWKDFRGQELKAGLYTLRYGQQPQDGNHIGTSELADFLLALPAEKDSKPETLTDMNQFIMNSSAAAGSTHPAIFSLLPPDKAGDAKLSHKDDREFWVLDVTVDGKENDKAVKVPLKLVVVGISEV